MLDHGGDGITTITSKGAKELGLMLIKDMIKELELTKRRFLAIRSLVARLDQGDADRILMFATKAFAPPMDVLKNTFMDLNDCVLEPLCEALAEMKVKNWQEALAMFNINPDENNIFEALLLNKDLDN